MADSAQRRLVVCVNAAAWLAPPVAKVRAARAVFSWTGEHFPLPLQSELYLRARLDVPDAAASALLDRRRALYEIVGGNPGGRYEFVISESAVERLECSVSPAVASEQFRHLLALMDRYPAVGIRLLPFTAAVSVDRGFTILYFHGAERNLAYPESCHDLVLRDPRALRACEQSRARMSRGALSVADTRLVLTDRHRRLAEHGLAALPGTGLSHPPVALVPGDGSRAQASGRSR
ncbi:Scr1 family TA system antitoxin-like transcriptional regulator [Amycolatopsis sp. H20-H5]|uniref:Scr1 family TA system antitoxin-like transcriptional regulator n=1 Tax=Amycolatopsis sp. H20-H5 TaxID=3046309 RepID=UPI002DBD91D7|nr:Scr1 family TA system antitoxin-like transcriptional regulator [Amycolatopsis sp. H20-H5]MEC3977771.1 Scr1 family TA system antitoxin-like transcriptional regulator [Amycolatopsis sp. H20-H5]